MKETFIGRSAAILIVFAIIFSGRNGMAAGACNGVKLAGAQKHIRAYLKKLSSDTSPWRSLKDVFDKYRECMDISETYDFGEAIRTTFIARWAVISDLTGIKKKDDKFYRFVMAGLEDETANLDDIKTVYKKAQTECPKNQAAICEDIIKFAGPFAK